jgi:uncharacterized membrane protein required for colicin V production
MSAQEWRVLDGEGKEQGPYSFQDLQAYYTSGNITHQTMIWTEGLEEWVPAGRVEGLLPNVPQVVPLAPAPTVAVSTQPITTGGINLSPQIAGIAPGMPHGGPQTKSPPKTGAPTWLSIVTIASGVIALILYFFPWVSVSQDMNFFKEEKNIIKLVTQSGMQSITQAETLTSEAITQRSQQTESSDASNKSDVEEGETYRSSTLNLIAFIAIGIGVFFALIGLLNKAKTLTMVGQFLFSSSAILIGVQMAQQFPMVKAYIGLQEEQKRTIKESIKIQDERVDTLPIKADKAAEVIDETENKENQTVAKAELEKQKNQEKNDILKAKARASNRYATAFEPSCFITVAILGISILLVVVTMSSGDGSTIIVTNQNTQQQLLHGEPQAPGSGLRFH